MSFASPKFLTLPYQQIGFGDLKCFEWISTTTSIDVYKNNAVENELDFVENLVEKNTIASESYTKKSLTRTLKLQRNWNYIIQNENYFILVSFVCVLLSSKL